MKVELSTKFEGICFIARTPEEEKDLDRLFKKGHIHFVYQSVIPKKRAPL